MRWGDDTVGVVLTRNEVWLLLHALSSGTTPPLGWDGRELEPWTVGELRRRLQETLSPPPIGNVSLRPVIGFDTEVGRDLAREGVRPLVIENAFDIGSMLNACMERGWGAEISVPRGAML